MGLLDPLWGHGLAFIASVRAISDLQFDLTCCIDRAPLPFTFTIHQAQSEQRLSTEYRAHVTQLHDRMERQGGQLAALQEANLQAGQALMRCKVASQTAEQLGTKVLGGIREG